MRAHVEEISRLTPRWTSCYPNAGLPQRLRGATTRRRSRWRRASASTHGRVDQHRGLLLRHHARAHPRHSPRPWLGCRRAGPCVERRTRLSGMDAAGDPPDSNVIVIGERTNVTGASASPVSSAPETTRPLWTWRETGGGRRQPARRQHGRGSAGLGSGHDHLPAPHRLGARDRPPSPHDRFLEVVGAGGWPQVHAGQGGG
jgi:hypothetical protein